MRRWATIVVVTGLAAGCATRTPEDPTGSRSSFQPPTSPSIVLDNLRNAVAEKNAENFVLCLADVDTRSRFAYVFEPSAEVRARYGSLFERWTIQAERQAFLSLIARLPQEQAPNLAFTSLSTVFSSPDSTVYVTDYVLNAAHDIASVPTTLTGTLVFTITPELAGSWSISSWRDAKRTSDTVEQTWSLLKAQLSN